MDEAAAAGVIARTLDGAIALHQQVRRMDLSPAARAATAIAAAIAAGRTVLVFGNGGSAADAQHFAAELVGRFMRDRQGLPAIALTTDSSVLTSVGNDFGFEHVFARQVEALGRAGDVALGLSTSGRSANVIAAMHTARERGLTTIALTGGDDGGPLGRSVEIHVHIAESSPQRVQEVHMTLLHAICEIVETVNA